VAVVELAIKHELITQGVRGMGPEPDAHPRRDRAIKTLFGVRKIDEEPSRSECINFTRLA